MPITVSIAQPRQATITEYPNEPLRPHQVRIRTLYSGISAGTELSMYRGTASLMARRWDDSLKLFTEGEPGWQYPYDAPSYEEVGQVVEVGGQVTQVAVGDVVWGTWGHRSHVVQEESHAAQRKLAAGADPRVGIFSQIGAIALNAILDADIHVGETVVVFGLGVPGQLAAQLARLNGGTVIGVDPIATRRDKALALGADLALDPTDGNTARRVRELTAGRGADVCIEISGHYGALQDAIRTVAYSSRVVCSGYFQGTGDQLRLGEEFHLNRVNVVGSQIGGVAPPLSHRWSIYRLASTAITLAEAGRLEVVDLISHQIDVGQAQSAFELLDTRGAEALQVVLDFTGVEA